MRKNSWWHEKEGDQKTWFSNWKTKSAGYATIFTVDELAQIVKDELTFRELVDYGVSLKAYSKKYFAFKSNMINSKSQTIEVAIAAAPTPPVLPAGALSGILTRNFNLAASVKTRVGYTEDIGKDLLIIGTDPVPVDWAHHVSNVNAEALYGGVDVSYEKGLTDGFSIHRKIAGELVFTTIATINHSPYLDASLVGHAGLPLKIEYFTMAIINDHEVGLPSPTKTVTFTGPTV